MACPRCGSKNTLRLVVDVTDEPISGCDSCGGAWVAGTRHADGVRDLPDLLHARGLAPEDFAVRRGRSPRQVLLWPLAGLLVIVGGALSLSLVSAMVDPASACAPTTLLVDGDPIGRGPLPTPSPGARPALPEPRSRVTGTKVSLLPLRVECAITAPDGRVVPTEALNRVAGSLILLLDVAAAAAAVQLVRTR